MEKCKKALGGSLKDKKISVWGLSFKANTDDTRFSPAISVIERLILEGAQISSFDPIVKSVENLSMKVSADIKQNVTGADAIVLLTEWQEFKEIDPKEISVLVTQKIIIDSRNLLNKNKWEKAGFTFIGNGYN